MTTENRSNASKTAHRRHCDRCRGRRHRTDRLCLRFALSGIEPATGCSASSRRTNNRSVCRLSGAACEFEGAAYADVERRVETQKLQHPLAALGALVGMAFVNPLVDAYATPDGVAALLAGMPPRGEPGESPPSASDQQSDQVPSAQPPQEAPWASSASSASEGAHPASRAKGNAGYRDIDTFAVSYARGGDAPPYSVVFHRRGWFTWQLDAVELPSVTLGPSLRLPR